MKAKDAKKISRKADNPISNRNRKLMEIRRLIIKEAGKGLYEAFYRGNISANLQNDLTSDGYTLEDCSDQDGACMKISWSVAEE